MRIGLSLQPCDRLAALPFPFFANEHELPVTMRTYQILKQGKIDLEIREYADIAQSGPRNDGEFRRHVRFVPGAGKMRSVSNISKIVRSIAGDCRATPLQVRARRECQFDAFEQPLFSPIERDAVDPRYCTEIINAMIYDHRWLKRIGNVQHKRMMRPD